MKRPYRQTFILALFFGLVYALSGRVQTHHPSVVLEPIKPRFEHDEFIQYTLRIIPRWVKTEVGPKALVARVLRNGSPVTTISGQKNISLSYDPGMGTWTGTWPCPWNAPEGSYDVRLSTGTLPPVDKLELVEKPFIIAGRKPAQIPGGLTVLTVEDLTGLNQIHWMGPDGRKGDWRVLVNWTKFIGADALWILSADSGGYSTKLSDQHPWNDRSVSTLRALGQECHKRGLKFGAWAMCYLVGGSPENCANYSYSWEYNQGKLIDGRTKPGRRAISILDPKRPRDIARLLSTWAALPEVDMVGMDYIRNALGGYETVDEFVRDMKITVPVNWNKFSKSERMMWLAQKKVARTDSGFIDAWQWWRAHKAASVIRTVKTAIGQAKPLWCFTLSWQRGWQHGQDPIMFRDAGADLDAVMLYECDKEQFANVIHDWETYLQSGQVNLLAGDCIDWILHQWDPAGPGEFKRRILAGFHHLCQNGPVKGVFIHDLLRALRGRTGRWPAREWMKTAASVIAEVKRSAL